MLEELRKQYAADDDLLQKLHDISEPLLKELKEAGSYNGFAEELDRRCKERGLTPTDGLHQRMVSTRIHISILLSPTEKFTSEAEMAEALHLDELQARRPLSNPRFESVPPDEDEREWFYQHVVQLNGKEYGMIILLRALELADDATFMKFLAYHQPIFSHNNISGMAGVGGGLMPHTLINGRDISPLVSARAETLSRKIFRGDY